MHAPLETTHPQLETSWLQLETPCSRVETTWSRLGYLTQLLGHNVCENVFRAVCLYYCCYVLLLVNCLND
ncbi:hypothetical protein Hanom_Chr00s000001g01592021 [Helianthus anomalus]